MLKAAAELLRGVKQQSRKTRKRGRATGSDAKFKLDATGPDAKMEREIVSGSATKTADHSRGAVPCWKLQRNF